MVLDYKICLLLTITIWGAFFAYSGENVSNNIASYMLVRLLNWVFDMFG